MAKSIKFKNDMYLDSESVVHKKTKLSTMLTYSTIETKIGTWIDGKTIYRKIVKGSFNCEQTILTGVDKLIHTAGYGDIGTGVIRSIPYCEVWNGNLFSLSAELINSNVRIKAIGEGKNTSTTSDTTIILEYTKLNE